MEDKNKISHTFWLNQIKAKTKASFVSWETTGDTLRLKIVKDKQSNYFVLDGSFENVTLETYLSLLESIEE